MNKTEMQAMRAVSQQFRLEWVRGLASMKGAPVIAALAQMLDFPDVWEVAMAELGNRKAQYPKPVAQQVLFAMRRFPQNQRLYQAGLMVLRDISKNDLDGSIDAVNSAVFGADWDMLVRKIRKDLRTVRQMQGV